MDIKKYEEYEIKWKKWFDSENIYWDLREKLVKRNASDEEFRKLEKEFGHYQFDPYQFGPYTVIDDPMDLINHNFILPGIGKPYYELTSVDQRLPYSFGKILSSKDSVDRGVIVGYGYDATDSYIIIKDESGKTKAIIMNSHYDIEDELLEL